MLNPPSPRSANSQCWPPETGRSPEAHPPLPPSDRYDRNAPSEITKEMISDEPPSLSSLSPLAIPDRGNLMPLDAFWAPLLILTRPRPPTLRSTPPPILLPSASHAVGMFLNASSANIAVAPNPGHVPNCQPASQPYLRFGGFN